MAHFPQFSLVSLYFAEFIRLAFVQRTSPEKVIRGFDPLAQFSSWALNFLGLGHVRRRSLAATFSLQVAVQANFSSTEHFAARLHSMGSELVSIG